MTESLCQHVRTQLAAYKAPREVEYVEDFVMTSSGKINRRILREAEEKKHESTACQASGAQSHDR